MPGQVMGVLNVTPDSFFDGGRWLDHRSAVAHGMALFAEGADVVDVGGESTRPGAAPVSTDEEAARVVPVIEALAPHGRVSVDTRHAFVAIAAVRAGATLINDVSASLYEVAAAEKVGWVAMHMQGAPQTMQANPHYDDVVSEVASFLFERADRARLAGVNEVWIDPGIGFGKTVAHNISLLRSLETLTVSQYPVLIGLSRKSFLGKLAGDGSTAPSDDRLEASVAAAVLALDKGASMVRVHDVKETVRAAGVVNAVNGPGDTRNGRIAAVESGGFQAASNVGVTA